MDKNYAVGIDLGTSNSALALSPAGGEAAVEVVPVVQMISAQAVSERETR